LVNIFIFIFIFLFIVEGHVFSRRLLQEKKGNSTFNLNLEMSILKRCKKELINMSSMELVFAKKKPEFV
jgi:hypothetical protein